MAITHVLDSDPQWLKNAFDDLGIHEIPTTQLNNKRILEMFQIAGHPEVKDDETAWCSAAMNTWFIEAGYKGTGSLMAQSWKTWGKPTTSQRGAVVVFQRGGKSSGLGHVALVLEDDGIYITHIGANQSDSVSIQRTLKSKAIAYRCPNTAGNSGTIRSIASGTALTSAAATANDVIPPSHTDALTDAATSAQPYLEQLSHYAHWAVYGCITLGIGLAIYGCYRHYRDVVRAPQTGGSSA